MTDYGQTVSIAATTLGVAGTIIVPKGARLTGINLAFAMVDDIPTKIQMKVTGMPTEIFAVPISAQTQTTQADTTSHPTPLIPLEGMVMEAEKSIEFTVTSTGNLTVRLGLMWNAAP